MVPSRSSSPPLAARFAELLLSPRELFVELRREPTVGDAVALSSALHVAASVVLLSLDESAPLDRARGLAAVAVGIGLLGLWVWLATAAFVGMAFGGFAGSELPFRAWLSLAAHCSLVAAVVVPAELAFGVALGADGFQPDARQALGADSATLAGAWLTHVSGRSLAFLTFFSLGAAAFTGRTLRSAAAFVCGTWAVLWLMLASVAAPAN